MSNELGMGGEIQEGSHGMAYITDMSALLHILLVGMAPAARNEL